MLRGFSQRLIVMLISASALAGAVPNDLLYVSPRPGAHLVRPETNIITRWRNMGVSGRQMQKASVSARGAVSGAHPGLIGLSDDRRTILFQPFVPFQAGEEVFVMLRGPEGSSFEFSFFVSPGPAPRPARTSVDPCFDSPVAPRDGARQAALSSMKMGASGVLDEIELASGSPFQVSIPSDFPPIAVSIQGETAEGKLFFSNWGGAPYLLITENDGTPVFYRRTPAFARDLKVQQSGILSYFVGGEVLKFFVMDSTYTVRDSIVCANGYETDEHELLMLPDGHYLLIGKDYQRVDMSKYVVGGRANATVVGNIVQELDSDHQVVFEWRSWDHYEITDCEHVALTASTIDYVHMNAIEVDEDGNLLLSCRNMSEITKIDRTTGEIVWRLGGKNSMFSRVNDPIGFSYQHDIRSIGEGHYTLYDNGNYHDPPESRALEYVIDTTAMSATLVWEYSHDPIRYSWWMGSVQRLPNGNTLIGWGDGTLPVLTEVRPDGTVAYELEFVQYAHSYRAYRFPWTGKASRPYLLAETRDDTVRMYMNTFGDSSIVGYRIFGGTKPGTAEVLDSSSATTHDLLGLERGVRYYLQVSAVDSLGNQGPLSEEVSVQLRSVVPGDNMVLNGDFSNSLDEWTFIQAEGSIARAWVTELGECRVDISIGGPQTWSVQLKQEGFQLRNGQSYQFGFRARSLTARSIEAKIEEDILGGKNYSRTGTIAIKGTWSEYSFTFTMQEPTDLNARMVFNCGKSNAEVFLDDISLQEIVTGVDAQEGSDLPSEFRLAAAYPNPFNPSTTLQYDVPEPARVQINVYTLLGQLVTEILNEQRGPGSHSVHFDSRDLASGVYFFRMSATSERTGARFRSTLKFVLMK